jgi:hypothetical protein
MRISIFFRDGGWWYRTPTTLCCGPFADPAECTRDALKMDVPPDEFFLREHTVAR